MPYVLVDNAVISHPISKAEKKIIVMNITDDAVDVICRRQDIMFPITYKMMSDC